MNKVKWIEEVAHVISSEGYISEYQDDNCQIHDIEQNRNKLNLLIDLEQYCKDIYSINLECFSEHIAGDGWSTILFDYNRYNHKEVTNIVQQQFDVKNASQTRFNQLYLSISIL